MVMCDAFGYETLLLYFCFRRCRNKLRRLITYAPTLATEVLLKELPMRMLRRFQVKLQQGLTATNAVGDVPMDGTNRAQEPEV
jgi:hypothetical protein